MGGGEGVCGHRGERRHVNETRGSGGFELPSGGINNQLAEETHQETMGSNCSGAELSTKQRSCQTNYAKRGGGGGDLSEEDSAVTGRGGSFQPASTALWGTEGWSRGQNARVIVTEWWRVGQNAAVAIKSRVLLPGERRQEPGGGGQLYE